MFISAWTFFFCSVTVTQTVDAQDVEITVSGLGNKKRKGHKKKNN